MLSIDEKKLYSCLSYFTNKGMILAHDYDIPNIEETELNVIGNYYSVIFNKDKAQEALYGPLPVAYHTEYLLYVYTFMIKDKSSKDQRIIKDGYQVVCNLMIFFPTILENLANRVRDNITNGIKVWKGKFKDISEITKTHMKQLNTKLHYTLSKEASILEMSESEKTSVVLSKSIKLLHNVSNYHEKELKILLAGTDNILFHLSRNAFLSRNSEIIDSFTQEKNIFKISLGKLSFKIVKLDEEKPLIQRHLSNNLNGVMFFGNFSTKKLAEIHSQQFDEILKGTNQNCLISYAISQNEKPVSIEETTLPLHLSKASGRIISLFDLAKENMNIGRAILESLDKLIEVNARVKVA